MLSGPAAGALGAALIAGTAGFDRVLTCDGGGTSTDVTVVVDGEPALTTEGSVGDYPRRSRWMALAPFGAAGAPTPGSSPGGPSKAGPSRPGPHPGRCGNPPAAAS